MNTTNLSSGNTLSVHAQARLQQRSIKFGDLEIVRAFGEVVSDGYLMSDKAIENCKHKLRSQIQQLERLRGVALIESAGCVITVYRIDKRRLKRLRAGPIKTAQ